jgi:hypothetical protein
MIRPGQTPGSLSFWWSGRAPESNRMAYVPGFRHDLFVSYAHGDDPGWIEGFEGALRQGLRERLGQPVSMWQDVGKLRLGQNWQEEIEEAIGQTAAFVAIVSPSYLNSVWCQRERRQFLESPAADSRHAAREQRFLKVIQSPADNQAHEALLPHIQHVAFFRAGDERSGHVVLLPGSDEFAVRMRETVHAVASLLRAMRRSREPVFVATPADDGMSAWEELRAELQAQSFDVRPEGPLDASFADDLVRRELEPAVLSVFLLTGRHEPFIERQLAFARDLKKRLIFWLRSAPGAADEKQAAFIQSIRSGEAVPGGCTLLERMSSRDMIREVLEALKPRAAPAVPAANGRPRVYLLYDPTTEGDSRLASDVRASIQSERLEVFLPQAGATTAGDRLERHRQLLRDCDGVLLCRGACPPPDQWLFQTVPEVLFAEQQLGRPPMASKAFLLADPGPLSGLANVIPLAAQVSAAALEPFLAPLRHVRPADARA